MNGGAGVEGSDVLSPNDSDISRLPREMPYAWLAADANATPPKQQDTARISVREWNAEERRLVVRADRGGYLIVRLLNFPAWQLRLDGRDESSREQRDDGLIAIQIPAGISRIELVYREPADEFVGRMISLAAMLVLLFLSLWRVRAERRVASSRLS
jgi:hypothetical protein